MAPTISLMARCANCSASSICGSDTSLALASTMVMCSAVPATTRLRSLVSSCAGVGLSTGVPSTSPTRTAPVGPSHGSGLTWSAALAATMPRMSGSFSSSQLCTTTCTCRSSL